MGKIMIAGPCSVESREQLREVSVALREVPGVAMIRGGVWKPRTRPGGFEGLGEPALQWMRELGDELGVRYCCEVAKAEHVELCQSYGINDIWIGARTTTSPFMVDEICQALRGSQMSVMVKNPISPDLRLWIGAIERVQKAGIASVVAVHRGFSTYRTHGYRNEPLWEIPFELRQCLPGIPLICDPSHIGGKRELVESVARTAMQIGFDGLMVEVHPHPTTALTDNEQQLTPEAFATLLANLAQRREGEGQASSAALDFMRKQMDEVDRDMLQLLARRMDLSRNIAAEKRRLHLSVYQPDRWGHVLSDRLSFAIGEGLDADFARVLLEKIHAESVRVQTEEG